MVVVSDSFVLVSSSTFVEVTEASVTDEEDEESSCNGTAPTVEDSVELEIEAVKTESDKSDRRMISERENQEA